jgi:hypothetical protein
VYKINARCGGYVRNSILFILPFVLYGEEYGLRVFENRVLRRIFGPNGESGGRLEKTA